MTPAVLSLKHEYWGENGEGFVMCLTFCDNHNHLSSISNLQILMDEMDAVGELLRDYSETKRGVVLRLGSGCWIAKPYIAAVWVDAEHLIAAEDSHNVIPALAPLLTVCEECGVKVERSEQ